MGLGDLLSKPIAAAATVAPMEVLPGTECSEASSLSLFCLDLIVVVAVAVVAGFRPRFGGVSSGPLKDLLRFLQEAAVEDVETSFLEVEVEESAFKKVSGIKYEFRNGSNWDI